MSRLSSARVAGFTFLLYIAAGLLAMNLEAAAPRAAALLTLLGAMCAVVLAVTLFALTRVQDNELALLAFGFRVVEGVLGAVFISAKLAMLSAAGLADASADVLPVVETLVRRASRWNTVVGATFFAVASTLMSYLFLAGRMIPRWLALLGLAASLLLLAGLPLQLAGAVAGQVTLMVWLPMALFEVVLGAWLLIRGVRTE